MDVELEACYENLEVSRIRLKVLCSEAVLSQSFLHVFNGMLVGDTSQLQTLLEALLSSSLVIVAVSSRDVKQ